MRALGPRGSSREGEFGVGYRGRSVLTYDVLVRPKGPVPVFALEWRIREDVPTNLVAVKAAAEGLGRGGGITPMAAVSRRVAVAAVAERRRASAVAPASVSSSAAAVAAAAAAVETAGVSTPTGISVSSAQTWRTAQGTRWESDETLGMYISTIDDKAGSDVVAASAGAAADVDAGGGGGRGKGAEPATLLAVVSASTALARSIMSWLGGSGLVDVP